MNRAAIIRQNLERIQEEIARAAEQANRDPAQVKLIGVSKYVGPEDTAELVGAGCHTLGESRPQQLWEKASCDQLNPLDCQWRLIGHLQRNKVSKTIEYADSIDSIDSRRLLTEINKEAASRDLQQKVLLEVNCSGDQAKHGFRAEELTELIPELEEWSNVRVCGLMTMAAREGGPEVARANFALLRELRDKVQAMAPKSVKLTELSMGMSNDFREAIVEGSTLVRIGSALWQGLE